MMRVCFNPVSDQELFFIQKEAGIPKKIVKVEDIPGLREAGWTPDQWGHSRFKTVIASSSFKQAMHDHPDAWPFKEPVDAHDVPDYYDIIKDPIGCCGHFHTSSSSPKNAIAIKLSFDHSLGHCNGEYTGIPNGEQWISLESGKIEL
ncbi:hypothetical protein TEA_021730 [Camellia sinensis var. sinensis]|uniref:Bromo domain-containing protein n=1 Tax=Camellia sinensis var. sinensis TaxID=542762 RepID=A0A4S4DZH3_CAMSN|nr:hypothetical protein TEA_021730 [Camellia sinensis var. sinensis]